MPVTSMRQLLDEDTRVVIIHCISAIAFNHMTLIVALFMNNDQSSSHVGDSFVMFRLCLNKISTYKT